MASRLFPGNKVTSFPPTKELVQSFTVETGGSTGTLTVPSGVTKIFATLIGSGGSLGSATITLDVFYNNYSGYRNGSHIVTGTGNGNSTTITVGGTTYTALGGAAGRGASDTVTAFILSDTSANSVSTDEFSSPQQTNYNDYIGSGQGNGKQIRLRVTTSPSGTQTKAYAIQQNGLNGETKKFEINVNPGDVISYSTGASVGGGPGAVYITY